MSQPTIPFVYDLQQGTLWETRDILAREELSRFRIRNTLSRIYEKYRSGQKDVDLLWVCPICKSPLLLSGRPNGSMYVRHPPNTDNDCELKSSRHPPQDVLDAIRFNGQKESREHIDMKTEIARLLLMTPGVSDVDVEKVVKGVGLRSFRRPDVKANFSGQGIAFEVQLSSTYLTVINSRIDFYRERKEWVLWVFKSIDGAGGRYVEKDVFYNNNCNVFQLDQEAIARSAKEKELYLKCHYGRPIFERTKMVLSIRSRLVPLREIIFCPITYNVFWFDHDRIRQGIDIRLMQSASIQYDIQRFLSLWEAYNGDHKNFDKKMWLRLFQSRGLIRKSEPFLPKGVEWVINIILSLRHNRYVGTKYDSWIEIANMFLTSFPQHTLVFCAALDAYAVLDDLKSRDSFEKKLNAVKEGRGNRDSRFAEDRTWFPFFKAIMPELEWERFS